MITRTVPVGRPMVRPAPRPVHKNPPHPTPKTWSNASQIFFGGLIGLVVLIILSIIYVYGTAGTIAQRGPIGGETETAPARVPDKTMVYRDMKNGRVVIMEVDRNGTRVVGTVSKSEVPMAADPDRGSGPRTPDTAERLNAFSQTFK